MSISRLFRRLSSGAVIAGLVLVGPVTCDAPGHGPQEGSETHFLRSCDEGCAEGFECLCGTCTVLCSDSAACLSTIEGAVCADVFPRVVTGRCAAEQAPAFCDVACLVDEDCSTLGDDYRCDAGFCREREVASTVGNQSLSNGCESFGMSASDVLILGDSLIEFTEFTSSLEALAIEGGFLQEGEHFTQIASATNSRLAEGPYSIAAEYSAASAAESQARLVVMDGGETDMFVQLCDSAVPYECPTIQDAVRGAQSLFAQLEADGVEQVVYFFYPDPRDVPELETNLNVLRPVLENACGMSAMPCHWVDLRSAFTGNPDYLDDDGMLFSAQGAAAAASAVWNRMLERCLAP